MAASIRLPSRARTSRPALVSVTLIGQTEKTMNAILDRLLAGAVSEPQWVTLVLITGSGRTADRDEFTSRVAHALKADRHTGDLPQPDLDVAARVLSTVLERAEADLACRS